MRSEALIDDTENQKPQKIYDCSGCKFNPNASNFCGFCLPKIMDSLKENFRKDADKNK